MFTFLLIYLFTSTTNEDWEANGLQALCDRFQPAEGSILEKLMRLLNTGNVFDPIEWKAKLQQHCTGGDLTFKEAYIRTGRALNIPVFNGSTASIILNYKTAPDVIIWSAVLASSALPLLLPAQPLMMKVYPICLLVYLLACLLIDLFTY